MNNDELDKILLSERQLEPSSSFAPEAMVRIHAEASLDRGIPFPWVWFTALTLGIAVVLIFVFPSEPRTIHSLFYGIGSWIISPSDLPLRNAVLSGFASLCGTLLLVWFSLRLAGSRS